MKCDLSKITCIEDLRLVAKRKMPRMFYDYIDSGSWTETTYRENTSDFKDIRFRQKVLVNMEGRSLETKMIGQDVKMPVAIAPTGFTGMAHADGEILAARAAENLVFRLRCRPCLFVRLKMWLKTPARRFGFSFM